MYSYFGKLSVSDKETSFYYRKELVERYNFFAVIRIIEYI